MFMPPTATLQIAIAYTYNKNSYVVLLYMKLSGKFTVYSVYCCLLYCHQTHTFIIKAKPYIHAAHKLIFEYSRSSVTTTKMGASRRIS